MEKVRKILAWAFFTWFGIIALGWVIWEFTG